MHGRIELVMALALVACTAPPPKLEVDESRPVVEPKPAASPATEAPAPEDPTQLCEAGWEAFRAGDPRAEQLLRDGIEHGTTDRGQAACFYSLGRVFERKGQLSNAVVAYTRSFERHPNNTETRNRLHALTGTIEHTPTGECPPKGRFADVETFCLALVAADALANPLLDHPARDEDQPFHCDVLESRFEIEGIPSGELIAVSKPDPHGWPIWSDYLLLRRNGQLEPLGRVGTGSARTHSSGSIEIERARWQSSSVQLSVDLHWHHEYWGQETKAWVDCVHAGMSESICDRVNDQHPIDITDERYRMICAEIDGRMRCSAPPEDASEDQAAAARFNPLPTGDALTAALVCP